VSNEKSANVVRAIALFICDPPTRLSPFAEHIRAAQADFAARLEDVTEALADVTFGEFADAERPLRPESKLSVEAFAFGDLGLPAALVTRLADLRKQQAVRTVQRSVQKWLVRRNERKRAAEEQEVSIRASECGWYGRKAADSSLKNELLKGRQVRSDEVSVNALGHFLAAPAGKARVSVLKACCFGARGRLMRAEFRETVDAAVSQMQSHPTNLPFILTSSLSPAVVLQ
jgi:hypothetical protein